MAKDLYFYDVNANRRRVKELYFYDGNSNRRKVTSAYFYDGNGNRRQFFSGAIPFNLSGTLTGVVDGSITGYRDGLEGDLTPSIILPNGGVVTDIYSANSSNLITLKISNYVSDPGKFSFTALEFNDAVHVLNTSASTYTWSSGAGQGTWTWSSTLKLTGSRLMEIGL